MQSQVATANELSFLRVQRQLETGVPADMDRVSDLLARDYDMLSYLFKHAAELCAAGPSLETFMLRLDYRAMRCSYRIAKLISPARARGTLQEMCDIVNYLANSVGERAACAFVQM